jgi:nitroreductase
METAPDRRTFVKTAAAGTALALGGAAVPALVEGTTLPPGPGPSLEEERTTTDGREPPDTPFFEVIRNRRSVRKFTSAPVPEDHMRQILDAARMAPTSGNQQPWKFLVVRDREILDRLKERCVERSLEARRARLGQLTDEMVASVNQYYEDYLSAPAYVIILTDNESTYPTYNHWDGPLAAGYLMLAARALGYGTVFCTDSIPVDLTMEVLEIPDRYTRVCITPVGVPVEWPETPEKKPLEEFIVRDRF